MARIDQAPVVVNNPIFYRSNSQGFVLERADLGDADHGRAEAD
jgi:hypothetical protein